MRRATLIVIVVSVLGVAGLTVLFALRAWGLPELAALEAAVGDSLPFEARLSGNFPPPENHVNRSGIPSPRHLTPEIRIAIARIEERAAADPNPETLNALGVALLVSGDIDRSVASLEEATSIGDVAAHWNDLSAAYLVKAKENPKRRVEYIARALDAAARSMRKNPSNAARFNYALAVEALSPYVNTTNPWDEYLRAERDQRWIAEGRRRQSVSRRGIDPSDAWESRHGHLRDAVANGDKAFIEATAAAFPEASTEVFEQELLVDWAKAVVGSNSVGASFALGRARALAQAISAATKDALPLDAIAAIDSLGRDGDRARLTGLAEAHLRYAEAIARYEAGDYPHARTLWTESLDAFGRSRSPYSAWASARLEMVLFNQRQLREAETLLDAVERVAREKRYGALLGRILWSRGLVASEQWQLTEAMQAFRESAAIFEAAGMRENAVSIYSVIGATLNTLGEHHESWEYIGRTLQGLSVVRRPLRRYLMLFNASQFASRQDLLEAALLLQDAAVRAADSGGLVGPAIEARTTRAAILTRRGNFPDAERNVQDASTALTKVADSAVRRYHSLELDRVRSELNRRRGEPVAVDRLQDAVAFFSSAEPSLVPGLYLTIARAEEASGHASKAAEALDRGITELEQQQSQVNDEALRISYFDEAWDLFPDMIALQVGARRDELKAFEYAERARGRSLAQGAPLVHLDAIQRSLSASVAVLYYLSLPDRLLIWTITDNDQHLSQTAVRQDRLSQLANRYRSGLAVNADRDADATALYEALIQPVAARLAGKRELVIIADGVGQQVPFVAIRNRATGRYLVEDYEILQAPSATFYSSIVARQRALTAAPIESALLVGNPARADAPALPGAEAEVLTSASSYAQQEVLVGESATKRRFVERAPQYDVVHFGGHAIADVEYPLFSRLSFSGGTGAIDEALFAHEIARMHFTRTRLVVLAACSTAVGPVSRAEGVMSLARPFLAAGVPLVIASQWDADDRATSRLFSAFHRSFARSRDAVAALRSAQLDMLKGGNASDARPGRWAAFIPIGAADRPSVAGS